MIYRKAYAAPAALPPPAPPVPPPAPPQQVVVKNVNDPSAAFAGVAALGSAFAGFLSYSHEPAVLPTAIAAGVTFVGALIGLHVLHFVFRVVMGLGKFAVPAAAILMIGCALDWPWAETTVDYISVGWSHGVELAAHGWAALRAG